MSLKVKYVNHLLSNLNLTEKNQICNQNIISSLIFRVLKHQAINFKNKSHFDSSKPNKLIFQFFLKNYNKTENLNQINYTKKFYRLL